MIKKRRLPLGVAKRARWHQGLGKDQRHTSSPLVFATYQFVSIGQGNPEAVAAAAGSRHTGVYCGDGDGGDGDWVGTTFLIWPGARLSVFSSGSASVSVNRIWKRKRSGPESFFELDAE
ncbi:hypothetical protein ACJ73_07916 [Blastomyces percursus]|uniref:Uncharacterized protein n=1 Tax=Blastomyces percursus TaxID=1658174 RepID=A0A1J9QKK4_9EURO|nr:hypothetical protein ACJ73_07916 [Blastomyces percursus]